MPAAEVTSDAPHRGRERWRRVWHAALGAAGFRAVSMLGTLVTVPLVLASLGELRFGALMVVTQLATLLVFSDLGLGNGLVTALAAAVAEGDRHRVRSLVASTWYLLVAVAVTGLAALLLAWPFLEWDRLLGIVGVPDHQLSAAVAVFAASFLAGLPASIAQKVHMGLQEGLHANAWQALGALLTIGATVGCVVADSSLPWYVAAAVGGSVVSAVLNSAWLFLRHPDLRPRHRDVTRRGVRFILRSGVLFLVLGAAASVAYQTDALVISHVLGTGEVTTYNIALRMFFIPGLAVSFVLAPLWPAFGDAFARGDHAWARQTLGRAMALGAAVNVPGAVLLVLFGQRLADLWVGQGEVSFPLLLLVSFGLWTVLNAVSGPLAMLLNGAHVVGFQVVCAVTMALSNIALSIALTPWLGVAGPVLGSVIAQTVFITLPSMVYVSRMWRT